MKISIKIVLSTIFFTLFLAVLFSPQKALAYLVDGSYPDCQASCSAPNPGTCSKDKGCPGNCGTNQGAECQEACPNMLDWSLYSASCKQIRLGWCIWRWVYNTRSCSTGDKCITPETGLRAGQCNCGYGGIYKYCCDASGNPEQCQEWSYYNDGIPPPEGRCSGGDGYTVDGSRIRSSPCSGAPTSTPVPTTPPGTTPTPIPTLPPSSGDRCQLNVVGDNFPVGAAVPVQIFQKSGCSAGVYRFLDNIDYRRVDIADSERQLGPNCEQVGQYGDNRGDEWQMRSCNWQTSALTPGRYRVRVYYPGFAGWCDSPAQHCSDEFNLVPSAYVQGRVANYQGDPAAGCPYNTYWGHCTEGACPQGYCVNTPSLSVVCNGPSGSRTSTWSCTGCGANYTTGIGYFSAGDSVTCTVSNLPSGYRLAGFVGCPSGNLGSSSCSGTLVANNNDWWFMIEPIPSPTPTSTLTPTPTCGLPRCPQCTSPNNETSDTSVDFVWQPLGDSQGVVDWNDACLTTKQRSYQLYLESGDPHDGTLDTPLGSLISHPTATYNALVDYGSYIWGVKAYNSRNYSAFCSSLCSFTTQQRDPWWQTKDGDVHVNGDITSSIPGCATDNHLSVVGDGGSPGVVSWGGTVEPSLGTGSISVPGWQANTAYSGTNMKFDYLVNRLNVDTSSDTFTGTMPVTSGTYYSSSGRTLSGNFPVGSKIVIFVNGDVTVSNDIVVPVGGFFALISKGNITFADTVTRADGFYLADGAITVAAGASAFTGQGSFVGWGGFSFNRSLSNNCPPATNFVSRPDFYLNAPSEFQFAPFVFQEVAP